MPAFPFPNVLLLLAIAGLIIYITAFVFKPKKKPGIIPSPGTVKQILEQWVVFYQALSQDRKREFETRVLRFFSRANITGVGVVAEELDCVLIASSAVIPIFGYPDWEYPNLREVLLYGDRFEREQFSQTSGTRDILGMVGNGPYRNVMILSRPALRDSFANTQSTSNVGIHEFAHLVDNMDGAFDGIPEIFMDRDDISRWQQIRHAEMDRIAMQDSDINPYALTNETEFFAVVTEYFFTQPGLFKERHAELYELLAKVFRVMM